MFFDFRKETGSFFSEAKQAEIGDISKFSSIFIILLTDIKKNMKQQAADAGVSHIFAFEFFTEVFEASEIRKSAANPVGELLRAVCIKGKPTASFAEKFVIQHRGKIVLRQKMRRKRHKAGSGFLRRKAGKRIGQAKVFLTARRGEQKIPKGSRGTVFLIQICLMVAASLPFDQNRAEGGFLANQCFEIFQSQNIVGRTKDAGKIGVKNSGKRLFPGGRKGKALL